MKIIQYEPEAEYYTEERCCIIERSNTPEDPVLYIARARIEPGVSTRLHRLRGVTERYVILQGMGLVEVGNLPPQEVRPGDLVRIPADCPQRIANMGDEDLVFLAVCTPRFTPEVYEDMGSS